MEKDLLLVFDDIKKKISKSYDANKGDKLNAQIDLLKQEYSTIEISERHVATYDSLINKGKELLRDSNIKDEKKIRYYLRYCGAAEFDFRDDIKPLNLILKSFLLTSTLFFVLAPQYFSFLLPLMFVIPIFLGLRGMKKRVLSGLMMGISVVPMAILVAVIWLRSAYLALGDFNAFIEGIAKQFNFSMEFTQNLAIACIVMSAVMLVSSVVLLASAIKYRKMFI